MSTASSSSPIPSLPPTHNTHNITHLFQTIIHICMHTCLVTQPVSPSYPLFSSYGLTTPNTEPKSTKAIDMPTSLGTLPYPGTQTSSPAESSHLTVQSNLPNPNPNPLSLSLPRPEPGRGPSHRTQLANTQPPCSFPSQVRTRTRSRTREGIKQGRLPTYLPTYLPACLPCPAKPATRKINIHRRPRPRRPSLNALLPSFNPSLQGIESVGQSSQSS